MFFTFIQLGCPYETQGPFLQICFPALKEIVILNTFAKAEKVSFSYGSVYNFTCRFRFLDGYGSSSIVLKKKKTICSCSTIALSNISEITCFSVLY